MGFWQQKPQFKTSQRMRPQRGGGGAGQADEEGSRIFLEEAAAGPNGSHPGGVSRGIFIP